MVRVSRKNIVIRLPDAKIAFQYKIYVPKIGIRVILINKHFLKVRKNIFDGQNFWELKKKNYSFKKVTRDLPKHTLLLEGLRVPENPYHKFLIFEKRK
jgi:hypothetical protein